MGTQQREDTMPMTEEQAQQELESVLKEDGPETIQLDSVPKEDGPETLQAFLARHPGAVHIKDREIASRNREVARVSCYETQLWVMLKGDSWWYRLDFHCDLFAVFLRAGKRFTIHGKEHRERHFV